MITIFCAIYKEAAGIIARYELKKKENKIGFTLFEGEDIRVVLTGVGGVHAAAAIAAVSAKYPVNEQDLFINFGSCAGSKDTKKGKLYLINKIIEGETLRTFYPDLLYTHNLPEKALTSMMRVSLQTAGDADMLFDMEAAALYQAGNLYYGPHQMIFFKVVTDYGADDVTQEAFDNGIRCGQEELWPLLEKFRIEKQPEENEELLRMTEKLCEALHASVTMSHEIRQFLLFLSLSDITLKDRLRRDFEQEILPCKDKKEGKRYFERLKQEYL